jgi:hypothetical protein
VVGIGAQYVTTGRAPSIEGTHCFDLVYVILLGLGGGVFFLPLGRERAFKKMNETVTIRMTDNITQ